MRRVSIAWAVCVLSAIALFTEGIEGKKYLSCYREKSTYERLMSGAAKEFKTTLTIDTCMEFCKSNGMRYFGLQHSNECFCSNERPSIANAADEGECSMKCDGNTTETCGGPFRLSVYDSEEFTQMRYIGCYKERSIQARLMTGVQKNFNGTLTNQKCVDFCKANNFTYAGTQFKHECFCSNERPDFKSSADEDDCNLGCDGNETENCGGFWRLSVHEITDDSKNHVLSDYMGCYSVHYDEPNLKPHQEDHFKTMMTPEHCVGICYRKGTRYAGNIKSYCFCGNALHTVNKTEDEECDLPCAGNSELKCGGKMRLSIYHTEISDIPEKGKLLGCFEDNHILRILSGVKMEFKETNTPRLCLNVCHQLGYEFSGVQYGFECFCGNRRPAADFEKPENECALPCPGDRLQMCGGGWRLLVYSTGKDSTKPAPIQISAQLMESSTAPFNVQPSTRHPTNDIDKNSASNAMVQCENATSKLPRSISNVY